jgi:hypothetical protein
MPVNSNWQFVDPFGVDVSMATRGGVRSPEAQYPDGYLTPISWRRGRGAADVAPPLAARDSYDRGVNKHTKLPPEDYLWSPGFEPTARLSERVSVGPNGLPQVARQGYAGIAAERIVARADRAPTWFGQELSHFTDRPPWA